MSVAIYLGFSGFALPMKITTQREQAKFDSMKQVESLLYLIEKHWKRLDWLETFEPRVFCDHIQFSVQSTDLRKLSRSFCIFLSFLYI